MNNKLKIFENREFGRIRVQEIDNNIFFVAKDVCNALDIKNTTQAIQRLDEDERTMLNIGRQGNTNLVNEYGLYSLILASRKPEAKEFKRWITHEVIPSIRKHGTYLTPDKVEEVLLNPDTIINLATELKKERLLNEQNKKLIGELKPKADYTDKILRTKGTMTINAIANDYGMTANKMNKLLHRLGIQYRQGKQWLLYSQYRGFGYTHNKVIHFHHKDGTPDVNPNMEWTQKGRMFLYRILKEHDILPLIERECA
ncbi:MAG: phage antirepressor KilAC domain-containing protein [Clostridia bacterium]|nr:phage antirepressor KilAC domain-containing protein [Clostridia bacterium]